MIVNPFLIPTRSAQAIIKDFCVSDPEDIVLEEIMVDRRVFPHESSLKGCEARLLVNKQGNKGLATVDSSIPESGRKRFALAHELGHFELHRKRKRTWMCSAYDFLKWYASAEEEPEANAFAAELLMPEDLFQNHCAGMKPGFSSFTELAGIFCTSLTATAVRYTEIGNYPCVLVSSYKGKISWFRMTNDFPYRVRSVGSQLNALSCAGEYFLKGKLSWPQPERVDPRAWLEDPTSSEGKFIYEESFAMSNYGTVLTVIWE